MNIQLLLFSILSILCLQSLHGQDVQTRNTAYFSGVAVRGSLDVTIERGSGDKIVIKAPEKLQEAIVTEVKNGILTVYYDDDQIERSLLEELEALFLDDEIKVTVYAKELKSVSINGSADVRGKGTFGGDRTELAITGSGSLDINFDANLIKADLSGSGDLILLANAEKLFVSVRGSGTAKLTGSVRTLDARVAGSGDLHAYDLKAFDCTASVAGSGDLNVFVTNALNASVAGSGDIRFRGKPKSVNKSMNGSGDITNED